MNICFLVLCVCLVCETGVFSLQQTKGHAGRCRAHGGTEAMAQTNEEKLELSEREEKLIRLIREVKFGEIELHIADGQPVRLEEVRKSIKL